MARQAKPPAGGQTAGGGSARRFADYADLFNDFQALAALAINRGGHGLEGYGLGHDLSVAHRHLLEDVRRILIDGKATSTAARQSAAADWRPTSARIKVSLDEARKLGLPAAALAAVGDDIAMIGERYLNVRVKGSAEAESPEDYADTVTSIDDLLDAYARAGEAGFGLGRESVPSRPDAAVSSAVLEVNERARARLNAVSVGQHMSTRHRAIVERLRRVMLLTRTETPGAAYSAVVQWKSIQGELDHVMTRAPRYVNGDVNAIARRLGEFAGLVAQHYQLVHAETVVTALKPAAQPGSAGANSARSGAGGNSRDLEVAMLRDFRHMLEIVERGLTRVPGRPGEWLLTSGSLQVRIRDDEAAQLRATAASELKGYMAQLAKLMARVALAYESIKHESSAFKLHVLGGWGGASDPGSQSHLLASVIRIRDATVYPMIERGEFLKAFDTFVVQKAVVDEHLKDVAEYDRDLDVGYQRLSRSVQVLQAALVSLVPVAGEFALASGYGILAVAGTAVGTGAAAPSLVETGRELVSGEGLNAGKVAAVGRQGAAIGISAIAPTATRALGGVATRELNLLMGPGPAGLTSVIGESAAAGTVGAGQSALGGGSARDGFIGSAVGTTIGLGARGAGVTGPVGTTIAATGGGALGAAASGGDWLVGAAGGVGVVPGAVASAAEHVTGPRPGAGRGGDGGGANSGGGGGGGGGDDAVPGHVGPEGDETYHGTTPWMPPPGSRHLSVPALQQAVRERILKLSHHWAEPNEEWLELMEVDREELIAKHPEDRLVWDKIDQAWDIVRNPKKIENGIIKIYLGAAHEGITPAEWLIKYFGGELDMPVLEDIAPEDFQTKMQEAKPALDNTLTDAPHGRLTHMFQEFLLAEEWGLAGARKFRQAIAKVKGPPDASGKAMYRRVWDGVFDSLDSKAINRPERLGPILRDHLQFPGRPDSDPL